MLLVTPTICSCQEVLMWSEAIEQNQVNFHDAAIDRIEVMEHGLSLFLWGVEDHHYNSKYFIEHRPPTGKVALRFLDVTNIVGLPPDQYINIDLSAMKDQPQLHHNTKESKGNYRVEVVQSGDSVFNMWTLSIQASRAILEALRDTNEALRDTNIE
jgi:hypothetical protein